MFRRTRVVLAAVLAIAVGAVPLMLDQCAATCEAHHDSVASTPACHHHTDASIAHLGHAPTSCGHDYTGTLVTSDSGSAAARRPFVASVAIVTIPVDPATTVPQNLRAHAPPGSVATLLAGRSLPLRI